MEPNTSLSEQLAAYKAGFIQRAAPERVATLEAATADLPAWQQHLAALQQRGAQLVAVSPQTPDDSLSTAEKNELAFPVLSDSALEAATELLDA